LIIEVDGIAGYAVDLDVDAAAGGTRSWSMSRRPRAPSIAGSSTPFDGRGHGSSKVAPASATSRR